jgi:hypothetical protein
MISAIPGYYKNRKQPTVDHLDLEGIQPLFGRRRQIVPNDIVICLAEIDQTHRRCADCRASQIDAGMWSRKLQSSTN